MNAYTVEARSHPRFKFEVDISIHSRTSGQLKGYTVDISESGIAAMLTLEAPQGEILELDFTLPSGPVIILAMVRQRNAFRYGFEFVDTDSVYELIRRTCRDLAVDQSLTLPSRSKSQFAFRADDSIEARAPNFCRCDCMTALLTYGIE
jgi:hypothetical protein